MSSHVDIRLRAEDEAALAAALAALPVAGHGIVLDVIGTLFDGEGEPLPGWHANLRLAEDHPDRAAIEAAVASHVVTPVEPMRVWFTHEDD